MENFDIKSLDSLYERLLPALKSKLKLLRADNINNVNIEDIWRYLTIHKWEKSHGLELYEMVDDILNTDNNDFLKYKGSNNNELELPKLK